MTITWRPAKKKAKVQRILNDHDVGSDECDVAAKLIWPLAREQDTEAACMPPRTGGAPAGVDA